MLTTGTKQLDANMLTPLQHDIIFLSFRVSQISFLRARTGGCSVL